MFVGNETLFSGTTLTSELEARRKSTVRRLMNLSLEELDAREREQVPDPEGPAITIRRDLATLDVTTVGEKLKAVLTLPIEGDVELLNHRVEAPGVGPTAKRPPLRCRLSDNLSWAAEQPAGTFESSDWSNTPPEGTPGAVFAQLFPSTADRDEVRTWAADLATRVEAGAELVNAAMRAHREAARTTAAEAVDARRAALNKSTEMRFDRGI